MNNTRYEDFCNRMRVYRKRLGYNQADIGKELGISQNDYSKRENGLIMISYDNLKKLQEIGMDIDELVSGKRDDIDTKDLDELISDCESEELKDMTMRMVAECIKYYRVNDTKNKDNDTQSRFQFRHTHTHSHSADDHSDDHADEHSDEHTADDHADEYTAGEHSDDHSEDNHADYHSLEAGHSHTDDDIEYDEHIWLSLKNAAILTQYLADIVKDLDKDNSQLYQDNADAYINQLAGLDSDYENVCENSRLKTVVFGDRFPFRYLVDDYGIDYYAAFAGCSAETEASFKTVTFLSGKIDEIGTGSILVIDGSDKRIANTIKGNTSQKNQQILTMDSMQSAGTDDADYTYLNVMSNNLVVLKQALQ